MRLSWRTPFGPCLAQCQGISKAKGLNHANAPQSQCRCLEVRINILESFRIKSPLVLKITCSLHPACAHASPILELSTPAKGQAGIVRINGWVSWWWNCKGWNKQASDAFKRPRSMCTDSMSLSKARKTGDAVSVWVFFSMFFSHMFPAFMTCLYGIFLRKRQTGIGPKETTISSGVHHKALVEAVPDKMEAEDWRLGTNEGLLMFVGLSPWLGFLDVQNRLNLFVLKWIISYYIHKQIIYFTFGLAPPRAPPLFVSILN